MLKLMLLRRHWTIIMSYYKAQIEILVCLSLFISSLCRLSVTRMSFWGIWKRNKRGPVWQTHIKHSHIPFNSDTLVGYSAGFLKVCYIVQNTSLLLTLETTRGLHFRHVGQRARREVRPPRLIWPTQEKQTVTELGERIFPYQPRITLEEGNALFHLSDFISWSTKSKKTNKLG